MAQLVGASSHHRKVAGSIPGQGTYLGCGLDLWPWCVQSLAWALQSRSGCLRKAADRCSSLSSMFVSLSSSLPSFLSKSNEKKCPQVRTKKKKPQLSKVVPNYISEVGLKTICLHYFPLRVGSGRAWELMWKLSTHPSGWNPGAASLNEISLVRR